MAYGTWNPGNFRSFSRRVEGSSTRPSEVLTEGGPAFLKCLGNPQGPHALVCEWIGTWVADILGLPTFDFNLIDLTEDDLPFPGGKEQPGKAFAARLEEGSPWSGDERTLERLANPQDVAKLVVLDTLLLNWDRHAPSGRKVNYDNVFLSSERASPGQVALLAIDHSHVIGNWRRLDLFLEQEDPAEDDRIFGLFEPFSGLIDDDSARSAIQSLDLLTENRLNEGLEHIPEEWRFGEDSRARVRTLLLRRKAYLQETLFERLSLAAGPQQKVEGE